jgi:hypothetical protein
MYFIAKVTVSRSYVYTVYADRAHNYVVVAEVRGRAGPLRH